ncbi:MAG: DNA polymerase III subunit delta [Candidatus Paceibacterota bacterium]
MILFLSGKDTYRSRHKLDEIIDSYKKANKSGLSLKFFAGEKLSYEDFINEISSGSMFKEKKMLILKNISTNKDFQEEFLKNIKKLTGSQEIILFYEDGEAPKSKFFDALKKDGKSQIFDVLEGLKLKNWVKKEIDNYGVKISEEAFNQLIDFTGGNLWRLSGEINKLALYKDKDKKINIEDVVLLVKPKIETDIFRTIDAISEKKKNIAISLIHQHLKTGDNPVYLLTMINFQFRNLLILKSEDSDYRFNKSYGDVWALSKKLGMNPYVVKKTMQQIGKFSLEELKKIYRKISQIDFSIKTGKVDPEAALDLFISSI